MNKELMLSIQPKHLANILNGNKTLELRKSVPKDFKGWVNLYCTKGIKDILYKYKDKYYTQHYLTFTDSVEVLNSKVVARFWFDEYEKITLQPISKNSIVHVYQSEKLSNYDLLFKTCLQEHEMVNYLEAKNGYVWHIKYLEIFDKPLELSDFIVGLNYLGDIIPPTYKKLEKAPQSYQFVYRKGE